MNPPKHIARLQRMAASLVARMDASPKQADFDDERGELNALNWAIRELSKPFKPMTPEEHNARLPEEIRTP